MVNSLEGKNWVSNVQFTLQEGFSVRLPQQILNVIQITDEVQKLAWSAGVYSKAQFSRKPQNVVQVCAVNWGSIA